jgi:hypothetical protein
MRLSSPTSKEEMGGYKIKKEIRGKVRFRPKSAVATAKYREA